MGATLPQLGKMAPCASGTCTLTDAQPAAPSLLLKCEQLVSQSEVCRPLDPTVVWSSSWCSCMLAVGIIASGSLSFGTTCLG